jgi:hypothetical protein
MFGIDIFVHAVRMVVNNLSTAIRISGALMAVQLVVAWVFAGGYVAMGSDVGMLVNTGRVSGFGAFLMFIVSIVTSMWIAVAWHRFILIEEQPGSVIPAFNGAAIGSYFVAGLIFALILILIFIPVAFLVGILAIPLTMSTTGQPGLIGAALFGALIYLPLAYIAYRISPILPSAALGERMALKDAWYATGTSGYAFVVLTLVSVLAGVIVQAPASILGWPIGPIWLFLVQWATVMVGASILTTIYGHYVEKRPLDA